MTALTKKTGPSLLNSGVSALGAGVLAAHANTPAVAVGVFTMAFGAAGLLMQTVAEAGIRRRQVALEEFFREVGRHINAGESLDDVRSKLAERLKGEPNAEEAIFATVQKLLNATSTDVAGPLAHLAAEYFEKPVDAFFRGFAAVLSDLASDEFVDLKRLIGELAPLQGVALSHQATIMPPDEVISAGMKVFLGVTPQEQRYRSVTAPPTRRRLFRLLKTFDLGFDPVAGGAFSGARTGPDTVVLEWETIERLARYLAEPIPPTDATK